MAMMLYVVNVNTLVNNAYHIRLQIVLCVNQSNIVLSQKLMVMERVFVHAMIFTSTTARIYSVRLVIIRVLLALATLGIHV